MNTNILKSLGLTQNESSTYLAFLKYKEKTAAEVARILSMDKSSCYRAVESLVTRGLLITIPRKRGTTHSAVSPQVLKELLQVKKHELAAQENQLESFVSKLVKDATDSRNTFIKVEKGIEAVRRGMDLNLDAALQSDKLIREQYRLSFPYFQDKEHIAWVNNFAKRRIKAGVSMKVVVDLAGTDAFASLMKSDKRILKMLRVMPQEIKGLHALRISGDITCIISFDEHNDYIVITVKDKYVAQMMITLFEFVWSHSKEQ